VQFSVTLALDESMTHMLGRGRRGPSNSARSDGHSKMSPLSSGPIGTWRGDERQGDAHGNRRQLFAGHEDENESTITREQADAGHAYVRAKRLAVLEYSKKNGEIHEAVSIHDGQTQVRLGRSHRGKSH
jgi:hypothetical protein